MKRHVDRPTERHRLHTGPRLFSTLHRVLRAWLEERGLAAETVELVQIAAAELAANVAEHGYGGAENRPLTVDLARDRAGRITVSMLDRAPRFAPESVPAVDLDELAHRQAVRGRGLPLIRMIASSIASSPRPGGGNRWTLVFEPERLSSIVEEQLGQAA